MAPVDGWRWACYFFPLLGLGIEDMAETYQLFAFPTQAAVRRGEWNDVAAVLD